MSAKTAKQLLELYGLAPKSSFGQNFLEDRNLVARLAELHVSPRAADERTQEEMKKRLAALGYT